MDVRTVGRELAVDAILEGSVRLSGDHLRVTAQLVEVSGGYHLWSERYDGGIEDVLAVQEDIARSVVERMSTTLPVPLEPTAADCCVRPHSQDPEAYQLYLAGRYFWRKRDQVGLEKGAAAFRDATLRDPGYALPHAALAEAWGTMAFYSFISADEARPRSAPALERALSLEPRQPEVQHALAMNRYWLHWDFEGAERGVREVLRMHARHGEAAAYLAQMLGVVGRREEAIEWAERARSAEPRSPLVLSVASSAVHMAGLYPRGVEMAREAIALEEDYLVGTYMLALNLMGVEEEEQVEALFRRAVERSGRSPFLVSLHAWALAERGMAEEARSLSGEVEEGVAAGKAAWCDLAGARAAIWDLQGALQAFENAIRDRELRVLFQRRALPYQMLREVPRFRELCAAVGI